MDSSKKKAAALGMNHSTATSRLKKQMMFKMAQMCSMDVCFRCSKTIETAEELSLDHKQAWLGNPDLFWDLDNLAFSHLGCNSGHGNSLPRADRWEHGDYGYRKKGCRCDICKATHDKYR